MQLHSMPLLLNVCSQIIYASLYIILFSYLLLFILLWHKWRTKKCLGQGWKKNGRNKDWAEKKDRNGWVMDETRHILSLVTHCVTQKSDASQTVKYWTLSLYFLPVCQQWINIDSVDESRCIFVMLVTQKQSQQWKKTCSLCGCSLEANDWQTGELVATGSSNDDLSPTNH